MIALVAVNLGLAGFSWRASRKETAPAWLPSPAAVLSPIEVPAAQAARAEALLQRINAALRAGRLEEAEAFLIEPESVDFVRRNHARGRAITLELGELEAQVREALMATITFVAGEGESLSTHTLRRCWIYLGGERGQLRCDLPKTANGTARVARVEGELRIDLEKAWIEADLRLTVDGIAGSGALAFLGLTGWTDDDGTEGSMQWEEISQDGTPCRAVQAKRTLLVELPHPAGQVVLRLRYRGRPFVQSQTYLAGDHAFYSDLIPTLPRSRPVLDVHVSFRSPATTRSRIETRFGDDEWVPSLLSGVQADEEGRAQGGWRSTRLRASGWDDLGLLLAPLLPKGKISAGGLTAEVYETWENRGQSDSLEEHLVSAMARLAPMGKLPLEAIRIAVFPKRGDMAGQLINDLILIEPNSLSSDAVLTHELAHLWFGKLVRNPGDSAARWTEGVSEYLTFLGLDEALAVHRRRRHLVEYDEIAALQDVAMTSEASISKDSSDKLSYAKATLLFEALELRIGEDAVVAFLRALAERHADQFIDWPELVQLLGERHGPEVAGWFREWLERPGAPTLHLTGRGEDDGRFHGAIEQMETLVHPAGAAPFRGVVELSMKLGDDGAPTYHRIELSGRRTEVVLPMPSLSQKVIIELDPRARFPRFTTVRSHGGTYRAQTRRELPDGILNAAPADAASR